MQVRLYSAQVRREIKAHQREITGRHLGRCIGAFILSILPSMLIAVIMYALMLEPIQRMTMINRSFGNTAVIPTDIITIMSRIWMIIIVISLLSVIVIGPLRMGFQNFIISLSREEEPRASSIFSPFHSLKEIWRGIRMSFCLGFRTILWELPFLVVYFILFVIGIMMIAVSAYGGGQNAGGIVVIALAIVALIVGVIVAMVKGYEYTAGYVVLQKNEHMGAWEATSIAAATFRGHFKDVLAFMFSFVLWVIPYVLVYSIVMTVMMVNMEQSLGMAIIAMVIMMVLNVVYGAFLSVYQLSSLYEIFEYLTPVADEPFAQRLEKPASMIPTRVETPRSTQDEQSEQQDSTDTTSDDDHKNDI